MGAMSHDFDCMVMGETVSSILPRVLTMCFTQIELDDPSKKRFDSCRTRAGEIHTLNSTPRGPTNGVQFSSVHLFSTASYLQFHRGCNWIRWRLRQQRVMRWAGPNNVELDLLSSCQDSKPCSPNRSDARSSVSPLA